MRDLRIDFLKFVGLVMIILAHSGPPGGIFQLRNFDVPLMVFCSGFVFSYAVSYSGYLSYVMARLQRLVIPVWFFLLFFFAFNSALASDPDYVLLTFLFVEGEGLEYLWIIQVFVSIAMVSPFIYKFNQLIRSDTVFFCLCFSLFILYDLFISWAGRELYQDYKLLRTLLLLIPYSLVFLLGVRFKTKSNASVLMTSVFCIVLFMVMFYWVGRTDNGILSTQHFKYPPGLYYLSYALAVTCLLLYCSTRFYAQLFAVSHLNNLILFVSSNSIWIYLWHIVFLGLIDGHWLVRWLLILSCSILCMYIQVRMVRAFIAKASVREKYAKLMLKTLTG